MDIKNEDLKIEIYSPYPFNPYSQNVGNHSNGVKITHIPTGRVVNCHSYKSQIKNKEECLKLLETRQAGEEETVWKDLLGPGQGNPKTIQR